MAMALARVSRSAYRAAGIAAGERVIPEEPAVAFTYNGGSYAVMMATPQDLRDFALGFSLTEQVIAARGQIESLDIVEAAAGIELRMWLKQPFGAALGERRRQMAGPTGCGLCGLESLAEAMRPPLRVSAGQCFTSTQIMRALQAVAPMQELNRQTRAVQLAGFFDRNWQPDPK